VSASLQSHEQTLRISVREARLTLDRIFLAANVHDGLVPAVRDHALASAALGLGGFPMVRDRTAAIGAGDASGIRVTTDERGQCIDVFGAHAWLAGATILDLCVDAAQVTGRAMLRVRNVADPAELSVLAALAHRHGAQVAVSGSDGANDGANGARSDARRDAAADDVIIDVTIADSPRTFAEWDPVLYRALHAGLEVDGALWWELHHLSNRALSPDTVESRRHAGPVIVTADGQVIGRPVDDDTDFALLKQGPRPAAIGSIHSKERQQ
jgi:hypothetical protein